MMAHHLHYFSPHQEASTAGACYLFMMMTLGRIDRFVIIENKNRAVSNSTYPDCTIYCSTNHGTINFKNAIQRYSLLLVCV
jgi:hypothetical protein